MYALAFLPIAARSLAWIALVLLVALRGAPPALATRARCALTLLGWGVGNRMPGAVAGLISRSPLGSGSLARHGDDGSAVLTWRSPRRTSRPRAAPGPRRRLVGAAWAAAELARGRLLNGTLFYVGNSPWRPSATPRRILPVIQIAAATGACGRNLVLLAWCRNAAAAEVVEAGCASAAIIGAIKEEAARRRGRRRGVAGLVSAGAHCARKLPRLPPLCHQRDRAGQSVRAERWDACGLARTLDVYLRSRSMFARGRPAIVFWPEASLTFFLESEDLYRQPHR